jgi:hypothetical protein
MRKLKILLPICLALSLLSGCSPSRRLGTVKFQPKSSEIFTKSSLNQFLHETPDPKIVLRIPTESTVTTEEALFSLTPVYNSIEKELIKAGITVRDRGLFNQVLENSENNDYLALKDRTDTDLILELVGLDVNVEYSTNKYVDSRGRDKKVLGRIRLNGAKVEFKIILVHNNELAGTYSFNYAPCVDGCEYYIDNYGHLYRGLSGSKEIPLYELVETNALETFMSNCTKDLIKELKE